MKLYLIALLFMTALVLPSFAQVNGARRDATVQETDLEGGARRDATVQETDLEGEQEVQEEQEQDEEDNEEPQDDVKPEDMPAELKDEAEKVKRAFPQISVRSCRILKKYGYCRNAGIARFCISTCRPCVDKLSRRSCYLLKTKYKQCRHHTGRYYCPRTCGHCGPKKLPVQCRRYALLSDATRRQSYKNNKLIRCDNRLPQRWYRFGAQGKNLPTRPTRPYYCGTHASGWMTGALPRIRGQTVSRIVCFSWGKNKCAWRLPIYVTNCGIYNVYYLRPTKACSLRYCGNL